MIDEEFSRAVIAYVGVPGRLDGRSPEERVVAVSGENGVDLIPQIRNMLDDLHSAAPLWAQQDIAEIGRQVEPWLHQLYPTLSRDAVDAVANRVTFDWR